MYTEKKPLISIITPVYNVERYLPQCIESIINQTFQQWELLLVDDGSKDHSGKICDEYAAKDARIRVIHKENSGQADSRNLALQQAKAPYIGFVDSDDWVDAEMFETLFNTIQENQADIAICGYSFDYTNRSVKTCDSGETIIYNRDKALKLILEDKQIKSFLWDKLYRREVIQELPPKSFFYEDYSTLFKWFTHAQKIAFRRISLYHYRLRKGSTDNVKDPQKKYHFFLAELERYNYLHSHKLLPEMEETYAVKVVRTAIAQSKSIARFADSHSRAMNYIKDIVQHIQPLLPVPYSCLGYKENRRLWEITHIPAWFIFVMRLTSKVSFKSRKKHNNFFE